MAAAELGVAMGRHGSDLALETADAVIVRDELATLPKVIGLSWDIVWILPLPLGVAGHEGSTVVVSVNGRRLLARPAWQQADQAVGRASVVPERQAA
jgi:cation transport ATPase